MFSLANLYKSSIELRLPFKEKTTVGRAIALFEAIDPFNMAPRSISNTHKVLHNLHMHSQCMWMCSYHILTTTLAGQQAYGSYIKNARFILILISKQSARQCLRIVPSHPIWLPHLCQTHRRCFTASIWCGCGCVWGCAVATSSLLLLAKVFGGYTKQYGFLLMGKQSVRWCLRLLTYPIWLSDQCQTNVR